MVQSTRPLEKALTGINGFDEMTGGGLPRGRTTVVIGAPGTGKTVFALQTLFNGASRWNEPGIFVAFEEQADHIRANAAGFGWDLPALEEEQLFFLDGRIPVDVVQSGAFDLSGMLASVQARAEQMGARRVVFDAIDVLLALLDDPQAERRELYRLHEWLQNRGYTGIVTAKESLVGDNAPHRYGFLQYMADCAVSLEHDLHQLVSQRYLRILKYRGSAFIENQSPLIIGPGGIQVAGPNPMQDVFEVSNERVSTGVEGLDEMMEGGYYRGTNILITGVPGTAKTTLAGAFLEAACRRGERALYVSFDEAAAEIVRNLASVNVMLQPHIDAGLLRIHSSYTGAHSAEAHFLALRNLIREHRPRHLVVDPLSAMLKLGSRVDASDVAQRLLHTTKAQGITTVCTSLLEDMFVDVPATQLRISTLADTWIQLSYQDQGGERNRALSIIKSRGTAHSNQVRELILADSGIVLADVYTAGGDVLMGTQRWQKEEAERREMRQQELALKRQRRELELAEAEVAAQIKTLQRKLQARRAELERIASERTDVEEQKESREASIRRLRRGASGDASNAGDGG
ncbi:MAG: circadian clock protein KaiC [bacterium]